MKRIKELKLTMLLVAGILVLSGCAKGNTDQATTGKENVTEANKPEEANKPQDDNKGKEESTKAPKRLPSIKIDIKKAVEIFNDTFNEKDINVTNIGFDRDNGRYTYEIEGWKVNKEYNLELDAESGEVLEKDVELEDNIDQDEVIIDLGKIVSPEKAMEEALKQANASEIEGWELDTDKGQLVYEVDVKDGKDAVISATDGSFIKFD